MKVSDYKRISTLKGTRKIQFFHAAITGSLAGCVAVVFQLALEKVEELRGSFLEFSHSLGYIGLVYFASTVALLCAVAAFITVTYAPETTGGGIPHTKAVLLYLRPMRWARVLVVKFFAGVLAIGSGLCLGREGPTIQLGAAVGAAVGKTMKVSRRARTHLIACGGGAGLSAAFNAPLAGFIFVIEELRRELSPMTYGTALIATVVADTVTRLTMGDAPPISLPNFVSPPINTLPHIIFIGIVAGFVGVLFNRSLTSAVAYVPTLRDKFPRWARAGIIGLTVGSIGWFLPEVLGPGDNLVEQSIVGIGDGSITISFVLMLLVLRFLLTILSYCAGVPGGIFAPLLVQGALLGLLVGNVEGYFFPEMKAHASAMGVIAMSAYFAAIARAPLTGVILIIEMTSNYSLLYPLLTASLTSYLVAEWMNEKPIYEALLLLNLKLRAPRDTDDLEPVVVDFVVESGSQMEGKLLKNVSLPKGCLIITHRHGGTEKIPDGSSRLLAGDQLTIIIEGDHATLTHEVGLKTKSDI